MHLIVHVCHESKPGTDSTNPHKRHRFHEPRELHSPYLTEDCAWNSLAGHGKVTSLKVRGEVRLRV